MDVSWPVVLLLLFFSLVSLEDVFPAVASGDSSASKQGGIQAISLAVTLGIALLGGAIVGGSSFLLTWAEKWLAWKLLFLIDKGIFFYSGFILKLPIYGAPPDTICFEDNIYWEVSRKHQSTLKENLPENYFPISRKSFAEIIQAGHCSFVLFQI